MQHTWPYSFPSPNSFQTFLTSLSPDFMSFATLYKTNQNQNLRVLFVLADYSRAWGTLECG